MVIIDVTHFLEWWSMADMMGDIMMGDMKISHFFLQIIWSPNYDLEII